MQTFIIDAIEEVNQTFFQEHGFSFKAICIFTILVFTTFSIIQYITSFIRNISHLGLNWIDSNDTPTMVKPIINVKNSFNHSDIVIPIEYQKSVITIGHVIHHDILLSTQLQQLKHIEIIDQVKQVSTALICIDNQVNRYKPTYSLHNIKVIDLLSSSFQPNFFINNVAPLNQIASTIDNQEEIFFELQKGLINESKQLIQVEHITETAEVELEEVITDVVVEEVLSEAVVEEDILEVELEEAEVNENILEVELEEAEVNEDILEVESEEAEVNEDILEVELEEAEVNEDIAESVVEETKEEFTDSSEAEVVLIQNEIEVEAVVKAQEEEDNEVVLANVNESKEVFNKEIAAEIEEISVESQENEIIEAEESINDKLDDKINEEDTPKSFSSKIFTFSIFLYTLCLSLGTAFVMFIERFPALSPEQI